jgi:hypothetical protein
MPTTRQRTFWVVLQIGGLFVVLTKKWCVLKGHKITQTTHMSAFKPYRHPHSIHAVKGPEQVSLIEVIIDSFCSVCYFILQQ